MKCKLCASTDIVDYKSVQGHLILRCKKCGLAFQYKFVQNKKKLEDSYSLNHYVELEGQIEKRLLKLSRLIIRSKPYGALLEVGAGYGLLSSILKAKGNYTLDIVEPSLTPVYLSKTKHTLYRLDLDRFIKINKEKYDIIVMLDVIEHLNNPLDTLQKLKKLLNKNGIIVLQTPNYLSFMQMTVKNWSWWMIEDHKWFFSNKSFNLLINKTGFKIKHSHSYEDWEDFKKNLDGLFTNIQNRILRKFIKGLFFTIFIPFYFTTRQILYKFGYGGLLFYIVEAV